MSGRDAISRGTWLHRFQTHLWTLPGAAKGSPVAVEIERQMVAKIADTPADTPVRKFGHPDNVAMSEWRETWRRAPHAAPVLGSVACTPR